GQGSHRSLAAFFAHAVALQGVVFPVVYLLALVLVGVAARRRSVVALVLAASLLVNVPLTFAVARAQPDHPLLLRYDMRPMPIVVVAAAWLLARLPGARRRAGAAVLFATLALSAAASTVTMLGSVDQLGERAFLRGLVTGRSQAGLPGPYGPGVPL